MFQKKVPSKSNLFPQQSQSNLSVQLETDFTTTIFPNNKEAKQLNNKNQNSIQSLQLKSKPNSNLVQTATDKAFYAWVDQISLTETKSKIQDKFDWGDVYTNEPLESTLQFPNTTNRPNSNKTNFNSLQQQERPSSRSSFSSNRQFTLASDLCNVTQSQNSLMAQQQNSSHLQKIVKKYGQKKQSTMKITTNVKSQKIKSEEKTIKRIQSGTSPLQKLTDDFESKYHNSSYKMMSESKAVQSLLANKQETPPSSSCHSDQEDCVKYFEDIKEEDDSPRMKFEAQHLVNNQTVERQTLQVSYDPQLENLIQQEYALSRIVSMVGEGQFKMILQLLPFDFHSLIDSAQYLELTSRAQVLALQMYLQLALTTAVLECCQNKVEHLKSIYEILQKCHLSMLIILDIHSQSFPDPQIAQITARLTKRERSQQRLTILRQNNEHNRFNLRKVVTLMVQELGVPTLIVELLALMKHQNECRLDNLSQVLICMQRLRTQLNQFKKLKQVANKKPTLSKQGSETKSESLKREQTPKKIKIVTIKPVQQSKRPRSPQPQVFKKEPRTAHNSQVLASYDQYLFEQIKKNYQSHQEGQFMMPETLAFLLQNSFQQKLEGPTINNNINFYGPVQMSTLFSQPSQVTNLDKSVKKVNSGIGSGTQNLIKRTLSTKKVLKKIPLVQYKPQQVEQDLPIEQQKQQDLENFEALEYQFIRSDTMPDQVAVVSSGLTVTETEPNLIYLEMLYLEEELIKKQYRISIANKHIEELSSSKSESIVPYTRKKRSERMQTSSQSSHELSQIFQPLPKDFLQQIHKRTQSLPIEEQSSDELPSPTANQNFKDDGEKSKSYEEQNIEDELSILREKVAVPYLPPLSALDETHIYTLVLDLDETLIHFQAGNGDGKYAEGFYMIRPGALKFIQDLSCLFELVIFTAAMQDYADWIIDELDEQGSIKHRLYRHHCSPHEDLAIKDLRNLGRDLRRTIIIDNLKENFEITTPENGIWVESWFDDLDDQVLKLLQPFLEQLVISEVQDVRKYLSGSNSQTIQKCLEGGYQIPDIDDFD